MSYPRFLRTLFDSGRVAVAEIGPIPGGELAAGDEVLAEWERQCRLESPGRPPEFHPEAGRWAGVALYRACQLTAYRDAGEDLMEQLLAEEVPGPVTAATHYSVDLVFRFLSDLVKLAGSISASDPLGERLRAWCREWPLSSVGVKDVAEFDIDSFAQDSCIMKIYVDRILTTDDAARANDPRVREAIAVAIGKHHELAGRNVEQLVGREQALRSSGMNEL